MPSNREGAGGLPLLLLALLLALPEGPGGGVLPCAGPCRLTSALLLLVLVLVLLALTSPACSRRVAGWGKGKSKGRWASAVVHEREQQLQSMQLSQSPALGPTYPRHAPRYHRIQGARSAASATAQGVLDCSLPSLIFWVIWLSSYIFMHKFKTTSTSLYSVVGCRGQCPQNACCKHGGWGGLKRGSEDSAQAHS